MLHVTNGDEAVATLRRGGIHDEVLAWRDVLHDGPVPDVPWPELRAIRADFIASRGWAPRDGVLAELERRDHELESAVGHAEEVRLWFEHDLYDQLQLIQVLTMLAPRIRSGARVQLVQADNYIGTMSPDAVLELGARRIPVAQRHLEVAAAAWSAFTAPTLDALGTFAHAPSRGDEPLPYVRPALQRLLQEVPSEVTGLSRTELQALRALAHGPRTRPALFAAAHHDAESPIWLGDSSFFAMLDELARSTRPLVRITGKHVELTADGRSVLAGRLDRARICGYDRWIGGTHLVATPD